MDFPRDRPTVADVLPQVWAYKSLPDNGVGGSLHIVLDDANLHDDHVKFCIDWAERGGDDEGARLGRVLLSMTRTQRGVLAKHSYCHEYPDRCSDRRCLAARAVLASG